MFGTKGKVFYPDFYLSISYYEEVKQLYSSNNFPCYRVLFFEDGVGSILINKKRIDIVPFTLFCLNEKESIDGIEVEGGRMHLLCFLPSAVNDKLTMEYMLTEENISESDRQDKLFFMPFIEEGKKPDNGIYLPANMGISLAGILKEIKEQLTNQNDSWPYLSRSYLIELLFLIYRALFLRKENVEEEKVNYMLAMDEVTHFINNNYMNRITIDDLAKQFGTNRTTLSKKFKAEMGETVINYLIKIRIQVAAGMVRDTELTIAEIIKRVGFKNISHFNREFKKYTQYLPNEYRRKFNS